MILNKFTLLYVEDDLDTREIITEILKDNVKQLYLASDGIEGLKYYHMFKPDIVLSDIMMPRMDGIEMAKTIKTINPSQPIAIFTAFSEQAYLQEAVNCGIDKYVLKPIQKDNLFRALESIAILLQAQDDKNQLEHILQVQNRTVALGEMLSNISHQWRQPLSVISSLVTGMQVQIELLGELDKNLVIECSNKVMDKINYLSKTLEDFRTFFQSTTVGDDIFLISHSIDKLITLVYYSLKNDFISIDVKIVNDFYLHNNENKLIQALLNIINNSKDAFCEDETNLNRKITIVTDIENNEYTIKIFDNAGGIQEDVMDKIFEPYFTTKHQSIGTGIGLYMTNQIIIKQYNGLINATNISKEFDGIVYKCALFTINIPTIDKKRQMNNEYTI